MEANRMRRLGLIIVTLAWFWAVSFSVLGGERPNLIVVLADDLGYSDLGCYGGEIPTPHIDGLAAGGVRFTQMYNSARCCPSRASLMTGLYPSQAGVGDFTTGQPDRTRGPGYLGRLNEQCVTLAEALKPSGYQCYYVGKWHLHEATGPIRRGFDEFYGYTRGHSHDQYDKDFYIRLPNGRAKEIDPPSDEYYATDVFNDYAMEFIRQGQESGKPWFLFLGHSSPHFPVQAPANRVDRFEGIYRRGWDVLREERFSRQKDLGLVDGDHWQLTPRSVVPVDRDDIANGYSGQENPAWDELDPSRQKDLARRMAVFAAMVQGVDDGVGRMVEHLRGTGDLDNTLILFLSDNGACYEWGPFGFDGTSRVGVTELREGDQLRQIGGRGTHQSYGSGWANLGNTPFRLYKHFTHEGGISTPFIAHWPAEIQPRGTWIREPVHVMDLMPTLLEAARGEYPKTFQGSVVKPMEGRSLLGLMKGETEPERSIGFDHQGAHAWRAGDWKIVWSKRMPTPLKWELYHLAEDRCELNDLADEEPRRVQEMVRQWKSWAQRVDVDFPIEESFAHLRSVKIAQRPLVIRGSVKKAQGEGVIVAQGGREQGFAVHLAQGHLVFDVRVNERVTRIQSDRKVGESFGFEATLTPDRMSLSVNGQKVAQGSSPGLIPVQPKDGLNVGRDELTAAGEYEAPNPFRGEVESIEIQTPSRGR